MSFRIAVGGTQAMSLNMLLIFTIAIFHNEKMFANSQYSVEVIGNNLQPSGQGVDSPGTVILLNTPFPSDGVVFAVKAYFRSLDTATFQIWRPKSNSSQVFTLVAEITAVPTTNTELIYMASKFLKCIRVEQGDRFGVYSSGQPSSIGYVFNPFSTQALAYSAGNGSTIEAGQTAAFTQITFPYDLSSQAFYYLESSNWNSSSNETSSVDCPPNLSVNDVSLITTSPVPISSGVPGIVGTKGPPGFTGAVGPPGSLGDQGATGLQGPFGPPGSEGSTGATGPTGPQGTKGVMGDTGDAGPVVNGPPGATGPMGPLGPPGKLLPVDAPQKAALESNTPSAASASSDDWSTRWTSELFMIGLLIWLAIVSALFLALLLGLAVASCVICRIRRHDDRTWAKVKEFHHRENDPYGMIRRTLASAETKMTSEGGGGPSSSDDGSPDDGTMPKRDSTGAENLEHWMGAMKEDSVQDYNVWYGVQPH